MSKISILEKFAVQSLVEHEGELIFSKEKFAELIVRECSNLIATRDPRTAPAPEIYLLKQFGVEE